MDEETIKNEMRLFALEAIASTGVLLRQILVSPAIEFGARRSALREVRRCLPCAMGTQRLPAILKEFP
jgi:hypothetical protein